MIRNAKVLGLALVAMLAMSAVVASAASATAFDAPSGATKATASQEANFEHTFTVTEGAVTCEKATFSGEASGTVESVEVTPVYTNCLFAGSAAAVDMNGCKYKLFAAGTADIVCTGGNEITVTVPPSPATAKCIIHIPGGQTGLKTVGYANVGATSPTKEVTISVNISGIKYSKTEGSGLGKCPTDDNTTNGTYVGKALTTGENTAGTAHTDIIWTA
jgi:hypothetical protein